MQKQVWQPDVLPFGNCSNFSTERTPATVLLSRPHGSKVTTSYNISAKWNRIPRFFTGLADPLTLNTIWNLPR